MWISKKAMNSQITDAVTQAQFEVWNRQREQDQSTRLWELEQRLDVVEVKTGIKTAPKRCGCNSEVVRAG